MVKKGSAKAPKVKRENYSELQFVKDLREKISKLQSCINDAQPTADVFQDLEVMINAFEDRYRSIRSLSRISMKYKGQVALQCHVLKDRFDGLTIAEIMKKYGIKSATTYHVHFKKMIASDWYQALDLERLKEDAEYRSHVFANDLNEHRDLLPDELKDAIDDELVCKEF